MSVLKQFMKYALALAILALLVFLAITWGSLVIVGFVLSLFMKFAPALLLLCILIIAFFWIKKKFK